MLRNAKTALGCITFPHVGIVILAVSLVRFVFPVRALTHPDDAQALKDLKKSIDPKSIPNGSCLSSWDFSFDPCDRLFSDRFTCGFRCLFRVSRPSRVTEITLDPVGYTASLSSSSWNLPYIHTLDLSDNSFTGSIPGMFSKLTRLRRLALSSNGFLGTIPESLGSLPQLEELYLDNNRLNGSIPSTFNRLSSLKRLAVQKNRVSGEIPDLSSLKRLYFLDLTDNRLTGEFPARLPLSLVELSIRNNRLSGNVPKYLDKLLFLQVLDLSYNIFSGSIPSSLFRHSSLQQLTLSNNNLASLEKSSGATTSSRLIALDLSFNRIGGLLPGFIAEMPRLSAISMDHNRLTGVIPREYAMRVAMSEEDNSTGRSSFKRLLLNGNYLVGLIPGPLMSVKPGSAEVSLADNCLYLCPSSMFFCRGKTQKSPGHCKHLRISSR